MDLAGVGHAAKPQIVSHNQGLDTTDARRAISAQRRDRLMPMAIEHRAYLLGERRLCLD
jgi:hypothetical protein